eukprot:1903772-Prymnesium_polylepis.2
MVATALELGTVVSMPHRELILVDTAVSTLYQLRNRTRSLGVLARLARLQGGGWVLGGGGL